MFRKGLFNTQLQFLHYSIQRDVDRVFDQRGPNIPSLSGSFFPNNSNKVQVSLLSQSFSHIDHGSPTQPFKDSTNCGQELLSSIGIRSTPTDRFPTLRYESHHSYRGFHNVFTLILPLLHQPWPNQGSNVRRPTDLIVCIGKTVRLDFIAMARTWLYRQDNLQTQISLH